MRKYRLTLYFVLVAIVVMTFTAIMVNRAGSELAEKNLIRITEENTARDAAHIQSMMRAHHSLHGMTTGEGTGSGQGMYHGQQPMPLTLEFLAGPDGLTALTPSLFKGLNIFKFNLFELEGKAVWSTDPAIFGITKRESPMFQEALAGAVASKLAKGHEVVGLDGVRRRIDLVETYLPLSGSRPGQIIGVMEVYRDVSADFAIQADDTRRTVLRTTTGYMAGLFLVFLAFIAVANMAINRSRQREASLAEAKLAERTRAGEELQRARDEAVAATRAKSDFLSRMSHEIRTPLNAIIGMADLLSESQSSKEQQKYVRVLTRAGDGLVTVVDDILDLPKVEARQLNFEKISFDLGELVEDTASFLAIRAHEKGLELNSHVTSDVPTALIGDPGRLRQVLINLIGNAIKFTAQGEVVVHVEADPESNERGHLLFRVSDTGIGIPQDRLESVFESFTQVDASTTREHGGTGLGLAISSRLVELMGGRIWVESIVGEGSTFYFTAKLETLAEPSRREALAGADMTEIKTLVVDDNATNRMILREVFAVWGAVVTEVEDGYHALAELDRARIEEKPYQLVLLDQRMPGMDGYQVAQQRGTLKKCVNSQAVYPLSEQDGLKAQERRYTAYGKEKHWEQVGVKAGVGAVGGLGARPCPAADPGVAGGRGDGVPGKGEVGPQV